MSAAPGLSIRDLTVAYGAFRAIEELSVDLPAGRIVGVVGPNGAGKTTLLNAITGFTHVSSGSIHLDGVAVQDWSVRRRVGAGVVRGFQTVRLMERESVMTNVLVGLERTRQPFVLAQLFGLPPQPGSRRRDLAAANDVIDRLGLADVVHQRVDALPFASRRLVEVARVLVSRPSLVLLDEPAAGLDQAGRHELAAVLTQVHEEDGCTMVVVEHDVDLVQRLCQHAVALDSGHLVAEGPPADVFATPEVQLAYFGRTLDAPAR